MMTLLALIALLTTLTICESRYQLVVQVADRGDLPLLRKFMSQNDFDMEKISMKHTVDDETFMHFANSMNGPSKSLEQLSRYINLDLSPYDPKSNNNDQQEQEKLQNQLLQLPFVTAAYLKSLPEDPSIVKDFAHDRDANQTPLFVENQEYLNGPGGFNVKAIHDLPGGKGENVKVIDVERGWTFDHEDLKESEGKVVHGTPVSYDDFHHGTAVTGIISGNENDFGITGIAPKSKILGSCYTEEKEKTFPNVPLSILAAAKAVDPGDIMLIEIQASGPESKVIAMEYWPDNFHALKVATESGVIVFEAAGNGDADFDSPVYSRGEKGFPEDWKNPFNRSLADSGAILVGAGSPGNSTQRLYFSNYGSAVDVQGWGDDVASIGYGDLYHGEGALYERNRYYTATFSGTSSATPCVSGCIAALQSWVKTGAVSGKKLLTPADVRSLLRRTGRAQEDPEKRIGNRPDMVQLIKALRSK
ncbi:intracellular serine protease [Acrasis kona]|uniref:Intracellular serine protease n=1 Tax=Acrasis kona TaxID=1008807 RepID=A0AAW2ZPF6_9EUKA